MDAVYVTNKGVHVPFKIAGDQAFTLFEYPVTIGYGNGVISELTKYQTVIRHNLQRIGIQEKRVYYRRAK